MCRSLYLTNLLVNSVFRQLGELPRRRWRDWFRRYGILKKLGRNRSFCGKNNFEIMTASPYLSRSRISRWKFQRDWPTGRNTGNNYYLPGVSRELRFYRPRNKNCLACVLCGFNRSGAAPYDSFIPPCKFSRKSNEPVLSDSESFKVCVHGSRWALPSWIVSSVPWYFSTVFQTVAITIITSNCAVVNCFRSSKFCKIYVSISRCVLTKFRWKFEERAFFHLLNLFNLLSIS